MHRTVALRRLATAGILAGLAGGVVMELFFIGVNRGAPVGAVLTAQFTFIAGVVLGPAAATNPAAVPIGVVLHFCVAVGWALGYVYLVRSQPQLVREPVISGAAFGLVVYVFMQIVLLTAGQYHRPATPVDLANGLLAHMVFYGIAVALVVRWMLRGAAGSEPAG
ncbi:MAG TPA: hypothetical protein VGC96_00980 [Candidatus Elarobacter sp.]